MGAELIFAILFHYMATGEILMPAYTTRVDTLDTAGFPHSIYTDERSFNISSSGMYERGLDGMVAAYDIP